MLIKKYEGDKIVKLLVCVTRLRNKKLKFNNILLGSHKNMIQNPDFERGYYSETAKVFYKIEPDSIRTMNWMAQYDH